MAVAHWLTQHAAQQRIHHHGCGMIPEIHSEDTPAATAAYRMVMNALVLVEAWRSSPDVSLGAPDVVWRRGYVWGRFGFARIVGIG